MARILHVAQPTAGGVAVVVRELARAGVAAGHDVTVASPANGDLPKWSTEVGSRWERFDVRRSPGPLDLLAIQRARRLAAQATLVHLHSSKAGAVGRLAVHSLGRRGPPCIFTPHAWSWFVGGRSRAIYKVIERRLAPLADTIVAVSEEEREEGHRVLGACGTRILVIPNGVDTDRYAPSGAVAPRGAGPLIVCVGRLTAQKGQDVAIRSLALLDDRRVRLRLVGAGATRFDLAQLARSLGVEDRLEFVGEVSDTAPHLRAADVVILPSRWEGLSLVLLEALACGCAVVATRVGGSSAASGVAELVDPEDPAQLAGTIRRLLARPELRASLGAVARARVLDQYDAAESVRKWLALYDGLLRRSSRKP